MESLGKLNELMLTSAWYSVCVSFPYFLNRLGAWCILPNTWPIQLLIYASRSFHCVSTEANRLTLSSAILTKLVTDKRFEMTESTGSEGQPESLTRKQELHHSANSPRGQAGVALVWGPLSDFAPGSLSHTLFAPALTTPERAGCAPSVEAGPPPRAPRVPPSRPGFSAHAPTPASAAASSAPLSPVSSLPSQGSHLSSHGG